MAEPKRYYWMKLKDSFMTSDTIDYFMSQPDGANYVVLYQMLCLKTINTDGRLSRQIGEIIIPYDAAKIQRDMKWFSIDTIRIALNLYRAVGLVYEDVDGTLVLADHKNLVGSESNYAQQKRNQRALKGQQHRLLGHTVDTQVDIVHPEKEIRDRDKEIDIEKEIVKKKEADKPPKSTRFTPPTLEEVTAYCMERGNNVDPKRFYDYFTAANWIDSKGNKVRSWKQKVITWESKDNGRAQPQYQPQRNGADRLLEMIERGDFDE